MRKLLLLTLATFLFVASEVIGQGSTTSSMRGRLIDTNGEALIGATVIATHLPTGSEWGAVTDFDGFYRLASMNIGGPYKVVITYVGFEPQERSDIYLTLGQTFNFNTTLSESATELEAIVVSAKTNDVFDGNKTGAGSTVDVERINATPSVSRGLQDFVRLNPLVNTQEAALEIAGINNRYNAIYIDGAVNNDVFGLASSGTNGGQTGVSPISVDAISQLQVSVAPFDVRQSGFAGGSINAVTRSGTNEIEGSAYYFMRNQDLTGKTPTDDKDFKRVKQNDYSSNVYGVRVGGPIIENKLFYFVNAELQREETPRPSAFTSYTGDASQADIDALVAKLNGFGYDPGTYENNTAELNSNKVIAKIDYNINKDNKLSLRHSYVYAENLDASTSSRTVVNFENNSVYFPSTTNSTALELKSVLSPNLSNNLTLGATFVNDDRDQAGDPFPFVTIRDGAGTIRFGSEPFSTANQLKQKVYTITDNLEFYKGRHTFTLGTHNEFYNTYNLFMGNAFGSYQYDSLSGFMNDLNATRMDVSYSLIDDKVGDGSKGAAEFSAMQLGIYVQDEFQASDRLKLTLGLRLDVPIFNDNTLENEQFNDSTVTLIQTAGYDIQGAKTGDFIGSQLLFAPRFGFNYDVKGDNSMQVRGGLGIFNSRVPLVWPGGAYNNNGLTVGGDVYNNQPFNPVWNEQPRRVAPGEGSPAGQIDLFASDFKLPQVFKTNLGYDHQLPFGLVLSLDAIYTKFLNNVYYQNLNLPQSVANLTGTPDTRPIYNSSSAARIDRTYTGIYLGSNTNKGYTYNLSAQLTKQFSDGFFGSVAYTYNDAYSVYDGTSSQNSSQWRGLHTVNGRNTYTDAPVSDFSMGSRVVANVSYRKEYFNFGATQISLFYNGQSGRVYSYIYDGNLTGEDSRERSLIYIPASQSEINLVDYTSNGVTVTAAEQWTALDAFIESDDYLSEHRGEYADRNQSRSPFENVVDFRLVQDFFVDVNGKRNTLQVSLDIFNFTNFLNKDWGRRYFVNDGGNFQSAEILTFAGMQTGTTVPTFTYRKGADWQPWQIDDLGIYSSRWQMQVGVRYTFN